MSDRRAEAPWAKVPLAVMNHPGATLADIRTYAYIDHRCGKRGYWYGPQQEIADGLGISDRTVRTAVANLMQWGYLTVQRQGVKLGTVLLYSVNVLTQEVPAEESDRKSTSGRSDDRADQDFRSDRKPASAPLEESSAPSPAPSETTTPTTLRALRIVAEGERPSAQPPPEPGPNARAVAPTIATGNGEQAVARALFELRATVAVEAGPPRDVQGDIAAWVQYLSVDDVAEMKRRAAKEGNRGGWAFIRGLGSRAASERRDGRDPWAPIAAGSGADPRVGRGGATGQRPDARENGRGRVGASGEDGVRRDRQGLPIPDLESFFAAQKPLGRDRDLGAEGQGADGGARGAQPTPAPARLPDL